MEYKIILTDIEDKALSCVVFSQDEWIQNAVHERCRIAIDELIKKLVPLFIENGDSIPNTKEGIIDLGLEKKYIIPLKDIKYDKIDK